jgi:hypothetical protein
MNIDQLFCTPEQGQRLKELGIGYEAKFIWQRWPYSTEWVFRNAIAQSELMEVVPALTLQELRDVARTNGLMRRPHELGDWHCTILEKYTAPELAAWVIERLEEE